MPRFSSEPLVTNAVRASFVILLVWAFYSVQAQSGDGTLHLEIFDGVTGQTIPAMVCITSLTDHTWRTPPGGRIPSPRDLKVHEFFDPPPWKPGQIGPVRLVSGDFKKDYTMRMPMYDGLSASPFWQEPASYFVSEPFTITLPVGKWRLAVARGVEHLPVYDEFAIAANSKLERKVRIPPWVDMRKQGWYSGDTHVHYPRLKPEHDDFLMTWTQAEDVHVTNVLSFGDIKKTYMNQTHYGKPGQYRKADYVLVSGDEDPRMAVFEQGHVVNLNITGPVRDLNRYHLYDYVFDGVHAQGGLTGYAHVGWATEYHRRDDPRLFPTWDPSINTIRGKVDFFEVLQFRKLGLDEYYDFLNLGVKLTALAGSDVPWAGTIGEVRTYAYTGPNFSTDAWFGAIKLGHTFITNGPMLTFSVQNAMPGDELRVKKNSTLRIHARAWAPAIIGAPRTLEIVAHGRVIRTVTSPDSTHDELQADFTLPVTESQWLAARVTSFNGAVAHSTPVYVFVDGHSFADREHLPALVEARLALLQFIRKRLQDPKFVEDFAPGEVAALTQRLDDAASRYKSVLASE